MDPHQPRPRSRVRRPLVKLASISVNLIHRRNPWMMAWWSTAFPGFGQLILGQHIKGFVLIFWEIAVNVGSQLNVAIMYSLQGQFERAKLVLDHRWFFLYTPVFIYGIWDSYRTAVSLNNSYGMAVFENARINCFHMDSISVNFLDRRVPWVGVIYSLLMPGLGQLYVHRLVTGFFILIWWIVIAYFSHVTEAIYFTFIGDFFRAKAVVDMEWLLFLPSIYGFACYEAYITIVELNNLFRREQTQYLIEHYQSSSFPLPEPNQ